MTKENNGVNLKVDDGFVNNVIHEMVREELEESGAIANFIEETLKVRVNKYGQIDDSWDSKPLYHWLIENTIKDIAKRVIIDRVEEIKPEIEKYIDENIIPEKIFDDLTNQLKEKIKREISLGYISVNLEF